MWAIGKISAVNSTSWPTLKTGESIRYFIYLKIYGSVLNLDVASEYKPARLSRFCSDARSLIIIYIPIDAGRFFKKLGLCRYFICLFGAK